MDYAFNRRRFITAAGAFLSLNGKVAFSAPNSTHSSDIKLGVASYSLRKLSRAQAIAALKELKTPYLNIKEFHLLYTSTPAELKQGGRNLRMPVCRSLAVARSASRKIPTQTSVSISNMPSGAECPSWSLRQHNKPCRASSAS